MWYGERKENFGRRLRSDSHCMWPFRSTTSPMKDGGSHLGLGQDGKAETAWSCSPVHTQPSISMRMLGSSRSDIWSRYCARATSTFDARGRKNEVAGWTLKQLTRSISPPPPSFQIDAQRNACEDCELCDGIIQQDTDSRDRRCEFCVA